MKIEDLVNKTSDAYSYKRYGKKGWTESIKLLRKLDWDDVTIEKFLRSKHMRWAADRVDNEQYGNHDKETLNRYFDEQPEIILEAVIGTLDI